jgi:hypothetical protein
VTVTRAFMLVLVRKGIEKGIETVP